MTGPSLVNIGRWLLLGLLSGCIAFVIMTAQSLTNIALGLLLGVVSGSFAFLAVRVLPLIWQQTGIDAWMKRRTGLDVSAGSSLIVALALAWTTRSALLGMVVSIVWHAILAPPASFIVFYLLFFPGGGSHSVSAGYAVTIGIVFSYLSYGLCAKAYWDAYRKANASRA